MPDGESYYRDFAVSGYVIAVVNLSDDQSKHLNRTSCLLQAQAQSNYVQTGDTRVVAPYVDKID